MNAPTGPWIELGEVESTQLVAADLVRNGEPAAAVFAWHQSAGKGRFGRAWHSDPGESLTFTLIFRDYADHPKPYLVGMSCALAAAGALHTQVRWPNDLVIGDKKVGGILTELIKDGEGRSIPVVGIGINLNQTEFPEPIDGIATSLHLAHGSTYDAATVAQQIVKRLSLLPDANDWSDLAPVWDAFDRTPGKLYRLANGDLAVAMGVGSEGQLICAVDGESQVVFAAEALFGDAR